MEKAPPKGVPKVSYYLEVAVVIVVILVTVVVAVEAANVHLPSAYLL